MKKIILILVVLLFTGKVNAQIVNIPDSNFKAALIANGVDTNGNGEIDTFETTLVSTLFVSGANISNLIGISAFTSLNNLYCDNNNITFMDLSSNINLTFLSCRNNDLSFLNLSNNSSLTDVLADANQLNGINISNNPNLEVLWIANNNITTLNTNSCTSLNELWCSNNQITTLNFTNNTNLGDLSCDNNQLTSLNVMGLGNLSRVYCMNNQLTTLDFSSCTNLNRLYCEGNLLTTLNLTGLANLHTVSCGYNQISTIDVNSSNTTLNLLYLSDNDLTSLDLNGFSNLSQLVCLNNQIISLNISNCPNLNILNCGGNQLTSLNLGSDLANLLGLYCNSNQLPNLDISNLLNLVTLDCSNNPLTILFLKNGSTTTELFFQNTPILEFICCDDFEAGQVQTLLNGYGNTTCVVNTYCTFTPGGDYNTITGTIRFDENNNGCDSTDAVFPNIRMDMTQWGINNATFTNLNGNYTFYTTFADQAVQPTLENPTWFNVSPASANISFVNSNEVFVQDFCISPNGVHPDVEVVIAPITPARPGFDAVYQIVYKNKGNQTLSGNVSLTFDDDRTDFVSAAPNPNNLAINSLSWNYTNLSPFENRVINLTLNVNSPVETPAVNIGDVLNFTTIINPVANDELPNDNTFNFNQTVVGSFDPNDITCIEGETVPTSEIGNYLHYVVNFENTGNYTAENVVVKLEIDEAKYDIGTLQLQNTSHSSYTRITNNKVEFIFEGINLEAAGGNPPVGGHGNVLFKIKSKQDLNNGDSVSNRANIYFDYNAPIDTNIAVTTYQSLNNSIFEFDDTITIYPNPTNGNININSKFNIKTMELYDIQGRVLETVIENSNESFIDVSKRQSGIYFIKITTDEGSKVEKIMKK